MAFTNPILGSGGTLVREAIKSPDYTPGSAGWTINRDGSAEFNNLTLRGIFAGTTSEITPDGIFFYSGPPATSRMVGSWTTSAGTDRYGNSYEAGLTVYDPATGEIINLDAGTIALGSDMAHAGGFNAHTGLVLTSSTDGSTFDDPVRFTMNSGQQNVGSGSGTNPFIRITDFFQNSAVDVGVSGALVKTTNGGGFAAWHAPTMGTGWATGPGGTGLYPPLRWRLDAEDNVHVFGSFHPTSTSPAGIIATGFPAVNQTSLGGVGAIGSMVRMQGAAGAIGGYLTNANELRAAITTGFTYAIGDTFMVNAKVPLGNLA